MNGNAALRAAEAVRKKIAQAAARKMACAPEEVVIRNDHVTKRNVGAPSFGAAKGWHDEKSAAELLESKYAPRALTPEMAKQESSRSAPTVSGRVEGQILRNSIQQKRKDEGPKESMSFEEAVVAAMDFHGTLTGTGAYAPPPEARGGAHKGA